MVADIRAAAHSAKRDRPQFRSTLNDLFRAGVAPTRPLNGPQTGSLILLDIAPVLTQLMGAITSVWLPWKGKSFDPVTQTGQNIFTRDSFLLARLFNPFYRGFEGDGLQTYRAFKFKTYLGPGLLDPDRQVFKIDYDSLDNPGMIRRVLDEIVQIDEGVFLGKANLHWWTGSWQTVAYFMLEG